MSSLPLSLPLARRRPAALAVALPRPELLVLVLLAAVLHLWALDRNGFANEYYSAAVRAMTESWHAFLFGSFDATGVMTVDKPPLALWVQALSAKAFGFSSWSLLVPQALMGVGSVVLAHDLVRRVFGRPAGFVAGLALALTPAAVAVARHNNPDALVALCVVAALWAVVRGLQDGRTRWLVLAGVMVGLGFEAKMATALLVVPGLAAAWLWIAPRPRGAAVRQLLAGGAAMTAVALAWPVLVWLTPASDRPWVSGTSDNSIWSLILGYNGLGRLLGQDGGPAGPAGGGAGTLFGGEAGWFRLLNSALGGQAGWLLGFALVAGLALVAITRLRRGDARTGFVLAAGGTWLVTAVAFSKAGGIFHPYYVSLMAPFTAALVGAGVGLVLAGGTTARVVGPLLVAGGVLSEIAVIRSSATLSWLVPVLIVGGLAAVAGLVALRGRARAAVVAAVLGLLLVAPATWSAQTLGHATSGTFPAGGPVSAGAGDMGGGGLRGGFGGAGSSVTDALAHARQTGGVVAVSSQNGAASQLITAGETQLAAIGGFSGRESQVTVDWLADAVADGRIRYVLTDGRGGMRLPDDGRVGATEVLAVAAQVGAPVEGVDGLYDLQGLAGALRAAR